MSETIRQEGTKLVIGTGQKHKSWRWWWKRRSKRCRNHPSYEGKMDRELSSPRTACLWNPLTSVTTVATELTRLVTFRLLSFVAHTARQLYILTGRDFTVTASSRPARNKSSQCHHTQYVQLSNMSNSSVVRVRHRVTSHPLIPVTICGGHLFIGTVTLLWFTPVWISGLCSRAITQIYATDRMFFFFTMSTNFGPTPAS